MKKTVYYFDDKRKVRTTPMRIVDGAEAAQIKDRHLIFSIYDHETKRFINVAEIDNYLNDYELRMFSGGSLDNGILLSKSIEDFNKEATRYFTEKPPVIPPDLFTLYSGDLSGKVYLNATNLDTVKIIANGSTPVIRFSMCEMPENNYNSDIVSFLPSYVPNAFVTNGGTFGYYNGDVTTMILFSLTCDAKDYFYVIPARDIVLLPHREENPVDILSNVSSYYKPDLMTTHPTIAGLLIYGT